MQSSSSCSDSLSWFCSRLDNDLPIPAHIAGATGMSHTHTHIKERDNEDKDPDKSADHGFMNKRDTVMYMRLYHLFFLVVSLNYLYTLFAF